MYFCRANFFRLWEFLSLVRGREVIWSLNFSADWLRMILVCLTFIIRSLIIRGRYSRVKFKRKRLKNFLILGVFIRRALAYCFLSRKIILFYLFFERSLIPIFLILLGWGYQPERLQAGLYMLFYTLFGSLPLLVAILKRLKEFEIRCYKIRDRSLILKSIFLLTLGGIFGGSLISWSIFSFRYDRVRSLVKRGMLSILFTGRFVGVWVKFIQPSNFIYFLRAVWVSPNVTATAGAFGSLKYGDYVYKNWDNGWSETVGPQGLMKESLSFGKGLNEFAGFEYKAILFVSFICLLLLICIIY